MLFLLVILVTITVLTAVHEFGHAFAMRSQGLKIKRISIGIPCSLTLKFRLKRIFPETLLILSPLLLAAFVEPDEQAISEIDSMPLKKSALIFGAGILANFFYALAVFAVWGAQTLASHISVLKLAFFCAALMIIGLVMWFGRNLVCRYVLPFIGIVAMISLFYSLVGGKLVVLGPIGISREITEINGFWQLVYFSGDISLGFGIMNCLPIFPLDGGKMVSAVFKERKHFKSDRFFKYLTAAILICIIGGVFYFDIQRIFK